MELRFKLKRLSDGLKQGALHDHSMSVVEAQHAGHFIDLYVEESGCREPDHDSLEKLAGEVYDWLIVTNACLDTQEDLKVLEFLLRYSHWPAAAMA